MSTIETPCIDVCVIEPTSRLCKGCLRSIDEIAGWGSMSPEARRKIMQDLETRQIQLAPETNTPAPRLKR